MYVRTEVRSGNSVCVMNQHRWFFRMIQLQVLIISRNINNVVTLDLGAIQEIVVKEDVY